MPDIAHTAPYYVPWFALGAVIWSSLFIEFPGLKAYLGRGWFLAFFSSLLLVLVAPALYFGVSKAIGLPVEMGRSGLILAPFSAAPPFTWKFFAVCAAFGLGAGLLKWAVLSRLTREPRGVAYVVGLLLFSTLGTTAALSELSLDSTRIIARVYRLAGLPARQPTSLTSDPLETAQPLLDYYKKLNQHVGKK